MKKFGSADEFLEALLLERGLAEKELANREDLVYTVQAKFSPDAWDQIIDRLGHA